jgi:hydrogenase/urease accessory protein HupE
MLWAFTAAGTVGLLLGLRFRMPSVLAASVIILVGAMVAAPVAGLPLWTALAAAFGALFALQSGYLVGLALWSASSHAGWLPRLAARDAFNRGGSPVNARARVPASGPSAATSN